MLELLRQYRRRTVTRLGVAFAGVWLAFAAVPCSALEQVGVDLGHMHAVQATTTSDHACPHCPAAQAVASTPGDCVGLDDALLAKVAGLDLTLAAPSALPVLAPHVVAGHGPLLTPRAGDRPPTVPLNLRFCTFLE